MWLVNTCSDIKHQLTRKFQIPLKYHISHSFSHIPSGSPLRYVLSRTNIFKNCTIPNSTQILTNWDHVSTNSISNKILQMLISFTWRGFPPPIAYLSQGAECTNRKRVHNTKHHNMAKRNTIQCCTIQWNTRRHITNPVDQNNRSPKSCPNQQCLVCMCRGNSQMRINRIHKANNYICEHPNKCSTKN